MMDEDNVDMMAGWMIDIGLDKMTGDGMMDMDKDMMDRWTKTGWRLAHDRCYC
jgi:hypothetical protein